jgi:SAM-dependent methyltransferase
VSNSARDFQASEERMVDLTAARDEQNIDLATSVAAVEERIFDFHEIYPFPWNPIHLEVPGDARFHAQFLNSNLGFWQEHLVPLAGTRIWVAGCGVTQAIQTALRFPLAQVLGTDISKRELTIARGIAKQVELPNLQLAEESINEAEHIEEFDYVLCTGVLHHQADPLRTLERLARALKPSGVLELHVYNRYHRIVTSAFQKAVQLLSEGDGASDFTGDLRLARKLLASVPEGGLMAVLANEVEGMPDVSVGDALIYPVEHSYTVRSLVELASGSGLRLTQPYLNPVDRLAGNYDWELRIDEPSLRARYQALDDEKRWHLANLVLLDKSPSLWFYLQRQDSPRQVPCQEEICNAFLGTVFRRASMVQRGFVLRSDGLYHLSGTKRSFPFGRPHRSVQQVLDLVDGGPTMGEILARLDWPTDPGSVNHVRIHLATTQFPYIRAA